MVRLIYKRSTTVSADVIDLYNGPRRGWRTGEKVEESSGEATLDTIVVHEIRFVVSRCNKRPPLSNISPSSPAHIYEWSYARDRLTISSTSLRRRIMQSRITSHKADHIKFHFGSTVFFHYSVGIRVTEYDSHCRWKKLATFSDIFNVL